MNGLQNPAFLGYYLIANAISLLFLFTAFKNQKITRLMFAILFAWACSINIKTAAETPEVYLEYSSMSIALYSNFINGWFSSNITRVVTTIAFFQGLIAIGMLLKNIMVKLACMGSIIFLLCIAPLGVGAGFPFPITVSIAAYLILKKDNLQYLWKFKQTELPLKNKIENDGI